MPQMITHSITVSHNELITADVTEFLKYIDDFHTLAETTVQDVLIGLGRLANKDIPDSAYAEIDRGAEGYVITYAWIEPSSTQGDA